MFVVFAGILDGAIQGAIIGGVAGALAGLALVLVRMFQKPKPCPECKAPLPSPTAKECPKCGCRLNDKGQEQDDEQSRD
jgi:hypothetical protein